MKTFKCLFIISLTVFYFISPGKSFCRNIETGNKEKPVNVIFASIVIPGQKEVESLIWARSIRKFGGRFKSNPIWVFIPNNVEDLSAANRRRLIGLGVELFPFNIDERAARFPLAAKPFAAAEAEKLTSGKCTFLAWIDPDNMVINEPEEFVLPKGKNLGYRPVHHINVGSVYDEPLNEFWSEIYKDCNVAPESIFRMKPNVEDIDMRPYFNAGHLVVRPERGILKSWRDNFSKLYMQPAYLKLYKKNSGYSVFVHQAILAGTILSQMKKDEICELSVKYNYPLNLYSEIPDEKRIRKLNDLVTARYDLFAGYQHWNALIEIDQTLKSWIDEQFRLKGINLLVLLDNKFGANYFLNRDVFEQYGWNVTIAGLSDSITGCDFFSDPFKFPPVVPDIKFDKIVNIDYFDALAIMPATSYYQPDPFRELMDNKRAMKIIREAVQKDVPVSTICSGARVLAAADVIRGKKITGQPSFKTEYEKAGAIFLGNDSPPEIQGSIMTGSRDQYYNNLVVMAMATMIEERGKRGAHQNLSDDKFIFSFPMEFTGNDARWVSVIGGFGADGAKSIAGTKDGGYILTGYTFSHGTGDADILVVKTDSTGKLEWSKIFGGEGTEYGYSCTVLDNGYLFVGYTTSFGAGSKDIYVIRTDYNGNEIWSKTFGGESWDIGYCSCIKGEGFLICGLTHSAGAGEEDVCLIEIDKDGNEIWSKTYGGKRFETANSVFPTDDGNFIIGATTGTFGGGNSDMYLIKVDKEGNELWSRSIGGQMTSNLPEASSTSTDWCYQVKSTSDKGFILVGYSNLKDIMNAFVVKTDGEGNIIWEQNPGNSTFYDYGYSIAENQDGGFIFCGVSKSIEQDNEIFYAKINSKGEIIYQKTIGTDYGSDWGSAVHVTRDGKILIAGQTSSNIIGSYDMILLEIR
ncbi:MAG TPA: DJ-1/PfpI family protein [Bacteroidales bacterium]|nr:DJ-1/PfpI family protein [Bacteroidales bacterium]